MTTHPTLNRIATSPRRLLAVALVAALAGTTSIVGGSPSASTQANDFYYYDGKPVALTRSPNEAVVTFRSSAQAPSLSAIQAAVPGARVERPITSDGRTFSLVFTGEDVVPGAAPSRGVSVQAPISLDQVRSIAEVEMVSPVFYYPATGLRLFPTDEVIVKLKPGDAAGDLGAIVEPFGLTVSKPMTGTTDEFVLRVGDPKTADVVERSRALFESGRFQWAEPNFIQEYRKTAVPNDPLFGNQWHLNNTGQGGGTPGADVKAPGAWDLQTGSSNIVIAIIDDGVEKLHEDLAGSIFVNTAEIPANGIDDDANGYIDDVSGWDFNNNDNDANPFSVDDNHGTAVAGVAAARGNNGIGVSGSCQACRILPIKIFSPAFAGDTAVSNAIRYAAKFADVLNNSWGGGAPSAAIQSAILEAITTGRAGKGSVVLFATGNSASGLGTYTVTGFPAGTHKFRWQYEKDFIFASGSDTTWLAWVQFPGGAMSNFEGGLPGGWTTGGNVGWSAVVDPIHTDEGACLTRAAKSGTILDSQTSFLEVVKTVTAGNLVTYRWVSSEAGFDGLRVIVDLFNDGSTDFTGSLQSGVPGVVPTVGYPAAFPESIGVGASTNFDCRSYYSQYGPEVAFVSPSNGGPLNLGVQTTDRTGASGYDAGSNYTATFGGTSSATPLASGIAGLILSRNPNLTRTQVLQIMQNTADKVGPEPYVAGRNDRYGFGRLNALAALQAAGTTQFDYTGDGKSDILWRHSTQGHVWLWPMNGATRLAQTFVRTVADTNFEIRGMGDQTGDGKADILWRNKITGAIFLWPMNGAVPVSESFVGAVDPAYDIVGYGDYNGDGKSDILWRHTTNGATWIWLMNGTTITSQTLVDTVDPAYAVAGSGDFNVDGKSDILFRHTTTGATWVWLMNGATRTSQTNIGSVATTYEIARVADHTGDGKADILWRHTGNGEVWIWTMNGAAVTAATFVTYVPDTNYRIAGSGDYNGDGKSDIAWRHETQGHVWVWLMNGTTVTSQTFVDTVADVGYKIVTVK